MNDAVKTLPDPPRRRLDQDVVDDLRSYGYGELADIAQKYVDADLRRYNRWYRRLLRKVF